MLLMLPWYGSVFRVWLAPVAFYAMLPMMVHALYRVWTTNHVEWKGRQV
jgi:hypothetical protein